MVSPKLCNNWKAPKEATMMIKYHEFSESAKSDNIEDMEEF
jgi:hypothetical protein